MHHATVWEAVADAAGDATALVQGDVRRSWRDFDDRAGRLASAFLAAGLGPGSKVGLMLYNAPEFMEGYFAALKIRAVPFNVNYRYVETELAYLLDDADAEVLVLHRSLRPHLGDVLEKLPALKLVLEVDDGGEHHPLAVGYEDAIAAHEPAARIERDPDDITLIYTGGTTGMPKGVMAPIGDTVQNLLATIPPLIGEAPCTTPGGAVALAVRAQEEGRPFVSLAAPPLMHNTAMGMAALPTLLFGGCLALLESRSLDLEELWDVVERERVASIIVVGDAFARPMLRALDERPDGRDLGSVTMLASAGAMFSTEVKEGLLRHLPGAAILDLIAASEGSMGMSISVAGNVAPTGTFVPGPGVKVFAEDDRAIEPGSDEPGIVALPGGAAGYFKDEAKTAATFRVIDGVRYTLPGDWATVAADGSLTLLGRGSQCINTAGEKVFPEEVEEVFKALPAVEDCLVFGVADERFGQRVAAVVAKTDDSVADEELVAAARSQLASYKLPRRIVTVATVPRMPSGKADYPAARTLFEAAP
ncbi:AMP-binding protein [Iamia sp. SCSIO 61187]|uniref:AMP-binding protein n=1 Tax=Iamia sp. SCSIO 61187 TaxID=2722752 RepID=UPI0021080705|nr:AMP-binding protein [Iamia sp. SCSIO 61187]